MKLLRNRKKNKENLNSAKEEKKNCCSKAPQYSRMNVSNRVSNNSSLYVASIASKTYIYKIFGIE